MRNIYRNIHEYAFSEHSEAFITLMRVFDDFSIRYFLIGAQARDVHFYQKGIRPLRATRDIDFAIMIENISQYERLIDALILNGFKRTKYPYRLIWTKSDTILDLLPFGQVEENHTVSFDKRKVELSVLGFSELKDELIQLKLNESGTLSISVPPLHGIFILKLLSWNDKKHDRGKDIEDIIQILDNYWEFAEDEAYEKHLDLFDDDFDTQKAAARILGRQLKITLNKSEPLKSVIVRILEKEASQIDPPGLLLEKYSREKDKPLEEIKSIIDEILKEIRGKAY